MLATMKGAGWILTAVTNGGAGQVGKLRTCGLLSMFDEVVLSEVEGFAKPVPELFEIALRRCVERAPSRQDWVMGDNPRNDIWAGTRAGLRTVWVSWGRRWLPLGYHPHLIAPSLSAAAAALLAAAPARTPGS
jgi:putative hydrolase of the HAD superfamily